MYSRVEMPQDTTPAPEYQYTGFTSLTDPTAFQGIYGNSTNQQNIPTTSRSMETKLDQAMSLYSESYSITRNKEWQPRTSKPQHTHPGANQSNLDCFSGMSGPGQDVVNTPQMPVPVSDPVPSTSILRMAAEEARQQSDALRTRVSKLCHGCCMNLNIELTAISTRIISNMKTGHIYRTERIFGPDLVLHQNVQNVGRHIVQIDDREKPNTLLHCGVLAGRG
jgi:hypothetical protein